MAQGDIHTVSKEGHLPRQEVFSASINTSADKIIYAFTNSVDTRTVTIRSEDLVDGREFIFKDESGSASTVNPVIDVPSGVTIDGQTGSATLTVDYEILRLYSDGTNLFKF